MFFNYSTYSYYYIIQLVFNLLMNEPIVQKARSRAIQLYQKIIISTYQFNTKHIFWLIQISVASEVC